MGKKAVIEAGKNTRVHITDGSLEEWQGSLVCCHCHNAHRVSEEMQQRYTAKAKEMGVGIERIWECGKCWLAHAEFLTGEKAPPLKTLCTHEVPPFSKAEGTNGEIIQ